MCAGHRKSHVNFILHLAHKFLKTKEVRVRIRPVDLSLRGSRSMHQASPHYYTQNKTKKNIKKLIKKKKQPVPK